MKQSAHALDAAIVASPCSASRAASSRQRIPVLDLGSEDERGALQGEPEHLEVGHPERAPDGGRARAELGGQRGVGSVPGEVALVEVEPAVLGPGSSGSSRRWALLIQPLATLTASLKSSSSQQSQVAMRAALAGIAVLPVEAIGPLAGVEDGWPVVEPPRCPAEALEGVGALLRGERALEGAAGVGPAQCAQGFPAQGQRI